MTPSPANHSTEFQKFQALARRILTTPKAELEKSAPKRAEKPKKGRGKK
jgi:hypothetical protein